MDQIASRACRAGHAALIDCRALEMSHHPLPAAMSLLSVYTGIPRSLAASEYNERRDSCRRAVDVLRGANPQIRALRDASRREIEEQRPSLGERIHRRARHVVTEQERVFDMVKALSAGDLAAAGHILAEGHRSLAVDYEVSSPQLDDMVDWLCRRPGIVGARLTGAGFGGSILAVGRSGEIDAGELAAEFCGRYRTKTPGEPAVWELRSVDGAAFMPAGFP
ncbi:MAG: hypothetical protein FJW35_12885 [Acidobacteria bacterium]|nr:hypothetical protein [Acidobacteriota bacterium]